MLVPAAVVGLVAVKVQVSYIQITALQPVSYPCPEPQRQGHLVAHLDWGFGEPCEPTTKGDGREATPRDRGPAVREIPIAKVPGRLHTYKSEGAFGC